MKKIALLTVSLGYCLFAADADTQKHKAAAGELKKTLVGELKVKMSEGPVAAVEFCSKNASTITESVAKKHGVNIKRVSDKNRNSSNIPDENDKKALEQFAKQIQKDKKPAQSLTVGGKYYEPLMTNEMCVVCHGKEESMSKEVKNKIKALYPADKAIDYGVGELRGMVVVW